MICDARDSINVDSMEKQNTAWIFWGAIETNTIIIR